MLVDHTFKMVMVMVPEQIRALLNKALPVEEEMIHPKKVSFSKHNAILTKEMLETANGE